MGPEAPPVAAAGTAPSGVDFSLRRARLDNGLRVVLHVDRSSPNVAVCVTYDVGARNERPGQAGFAHLFEHLMFEGSRNVPKGDHFQMLAARGGTTNGTTTSEVTTYYDVVPSSELELALWLESDRMKALAITQNKFENQRQVVQEEYRMRISNSAYAFGALRLRELAFQGYFPYSHAAIGSMEDLDGATLEWVQQFYDQYYAANNAVIALSGDFDPDQAMDLIQKHFGTVPERPAPPAVSTTLPRQTSERLSVIEDSNAKTPAVYYGYPIPAARTPEHYALELAASVLAGGESAALHRHLVLDKALALDVSAYTHRHRGPSLFVTRIRITERSSIDEVQKGFESELKRLAYAGPTQAELDRAKALHASRFVMGLQSNRERAMALATYETLWGDASLLNGEMAAYGAVSRRDVQLAVLHHLTPGHRSIVEVYPPGWVKDEYPAVLARAHIVRKGDTLIGIAKQYGVSVQDLVKKNRIDKRRPIFPGQKLTIPSGGKPAKTSGPPSRTHTVRKGETLSGIAKRYGVTVASIVKHNRVGRNKTIRIGQKLTIVLEKK